MRKRIICTAVAALALAGTGTTSFGVTRVWDGDTSSNWFDGNNWVGGMAPTDSLIADIADFTGPFVNHPTLTYSGAINDQRINGFVLGSTPVTFTNTFAGGAGNSLQFGSSGITTGSGAFTANMVNTSRFEIAADQTWNIGSGGMDMNTVSGTSFLRFTSSSFTLNKTGTGTLDMRDLSVPVQTTGKYRFTDGVVAIRHQDQLGVNNGSFTADKFTFDGGTLRISPTAVNEGNLNNPNNGIVVAAGGGTIEFNTFSTDGSSFNQALSGSGSLTLKAGNTINLVSMQADNSAYTGTLTLTGTNTFHNDFTPTATNAMAPNGRVHMVAGTAPNGTVISFNNSSPTYTLGALSSTGTARLRVTAGSPVVTINQSVDGIYGGTISDAGGPLDLIKSGSGSLTLGANSFATWNQAGSSVAVNAGRLTVAANTALGNSSVTASVANGAALGNSTSGIFLHNTITTGGTNATLDPSGLFQVASLNASAGMRLSITGSQSDFLDIPGVFTKPSSSGGMHFYFFDITPGVPYNLIDFAAAPGILPSDLVVENAWVLDTTFGTGAFANSGWNLTANNILQVQFAEVPEPTIAGMGVVALAMIALKRARRTGL